MPLDTKAYHNLVRCSRIFILWNYQISKFLPPCSVLSLVRMLKNCFYYNPLQLRDKTINTSHPVYVELDNKGVGTPDCKIQYSML